MGRKCSGLKQSKTVRIFRLKAYTTRNEPQIEIPLSEVMGLYAAEKFRITNSKSLSINEKSNIESSILPPLNSNVNLNYIKVLEDGDRKFETSVAFSSLGLTLAWVTILKIILSNSCCQFPFDQVFKSGWASSNVLGIICPSGWNRVS